MLPITFTDIQIVHRRLHTEEFVYVAYKVTGAGIININTNNNNPNIKPVA